MVKILSTCQAFEQKDCEILIAGQAVTQNEPNFKSMCNCIL